MYISDQGKNILI